MQLLNTHELSNGMCVVVSKLLKAWGEGLEAKTGLPVSNFKPSLWLQLIKTLSKYWM